MSHAGVVPLLEVRGLRVRFGGREVVKEISFAVGPGETLGLVGESGSGKSVTSLAVMRLLDSRADVSGEIWLRETSEAGGRQTHATDAKERGGSPRDAERGVDLLGLPEEGMRRRRGRAVAMVFQEPMTALNPVMAVGRQVAEAVWAHAPRTPRAEVRARVLEVLRAVGLPEPERRLGDYPHQFSGGQRQRLVIADEPTTALDVTVQAQILALLRKLRAEYGLAMLFISHDLAVVGQIADRIAVMRGGEIVEVGEAQQILTRPRHAYTQGLLAAAPTMRTPRDEPLKVSQR